jgi:C-terminal processing protease CtpA/Prc
MSANVLGVLLVCAAIGADKPRERDNAESVTENKARYAAPSTVEDADGLLGIGVKFVRDDQGRPLPGVNVVDFMVDSRAKNANINEFDTILEVAGRPVGLIRDRHYAPLQFYDKPPSTVELLVSFVREDGSQGFYYPTVRLGAVATGETFSLFRRRWVAPPMVPGLPEDYFRSERPDDRDEPEDAARNIARYTKVQRNNERNFARFDVGISSEFADGDVAVTAIASNSAAAAAGIRVGDRILEVDGAPVGIVGPRAYPLWRQLNRCKPGASAELLVAFQKNNNWVYFYPKLTLTDLANPN